MNEEILFKVIENLPPKGDGSLLINELVALAKRVTETTFPYAGKAKKEFLKERKEFFLRYVIKGDERRWIHLLTHGVHEWGDVKRFVPSALVVKGWREFRWYTEPADTLAQLRYRWGDRPIDELYSLGGVEVLSDNEVGEDIVITPSEEEVYLLDVEERNRLAADRGWCSYYHRGEQPLWWRGCLVHIGGMPRLQGDGWSHDRPFFTDNDMLFVVEARKPYNKELTEEEWDLLLAELELKYCKLQHFTSLQRGEGWVDTAGNADQLNYLLQQEKEDSSFHLMCEEMEQRLERKASSRRSTKCYNKERRRANR